MWDRVRLGVFYLPVVMMISLFGVSSLVGLPVSLIVMGLIVAMYGAMEKHLPSSALAWMGVLVSARMVIPSLYIRARSAITPLLASLDVEDLVVYVMAFGFLCIVAQRGLGSFSAATPADRVGP